MSALSLRVVLSCAAILLSLIAISDGTTRDQYCKLCRSHTMCRYSGVSRTCRAGRFERNVPPAMKTVIVNEHNRLRQLVARGQERRGRPGPQPAASNMQNMAWDNELAEVAQRWADQCNYKHDECRNVPRFYVGQNLYIKMQWPCSSMNRNQEWTQAIKGWYDEVALFNRNSVGRYNGASNVGHYTQIVWANTNRVGCGYTLFQSGNQCKKYYVCNYGPGGNYMNQPLYKVR